MSGGSTLVAFEVEGTGGLGGGNRAAFRVSRTRSALVGISNNLGDAKSLVTHPATTTHKNLAEADRAEVGITDATLRLSVGLEDPEDLWADIEQALEAA